MINETNYLFSCSECGDRWEEPYECACDDECPSCGTAISPYAEWDEEKKDWNSFVQLDKMSLVSYDGYATELVPDECADALAARLMLEDSDIESVTILTPTLSGTLQRVPKMFRMISPDRLPVTEWEQDHITAANKADLWMGRYKGQGFYSSIRYGRIPYEEIGLYVTLEYRVEFLKSKIN